MQNASLPRRLAAMLYDSLLVIALLFIATIPFIAVRGGEPVETSGNFAYQATLVLVVYAFFVGFWTTKGRTLGMQSWGLQLESANREPPTVTQASVRFIAALLSLAPAGLGFLWALVDPEGLTWHDRLSGTRLVYYPKKKADDQGRSTR